MALHFRPYPTFTAVFALLLAVLLGLGIWQLYRLQWKLGLIEQVTQNMRAPPISMHAALGLGRAAEYRHVAVEGRFDNAHESFSYSIGSDGEPYYHVIVPFKTREGAVLLVDRGIIPLAMRDSQTRVPGEIKGTTRVVGVWHTPDPPGLFTPPPDLAHRTWYTRNVRLIAAADHRTVASSALLEADATPNAGGWPKGGQTRVEFRNEHLQYAVTWFLMAAGLLGVYVTYHVSTGRLGWSPKD